MPDNSTTTLVIASILRQEGATGVHTHIREFRSYLDRQHVPHALITPFSSFPALASALFALRPPLSYLAPPAGIAWYRHCHTVVLERALRSFLSRAGPAVIYAQGPEAAQAALRARTGTHQRVVMAVHFLGSQATPWVARGHLKPTGPIAKWILATEDRYLAYLDAIVYVSGKARAQFIACHPSATRAPSRVLPNFVSPAQATASSSMGDLVTIGRLDGEKRHSYLLDVLAAAKALGHAYTLDIYGAGPLHRRLLQRRDRLGLGPQVRFRGFDPAVRRSLPNYRAYIHGCTIEAGPIAIVEAMAAGLPIFAPNAGGVTDLFTDGHEGFHLPADDPFAAATCLISKLHDQRALYQAGRSAHHKFTRCYSTDVVAPQLASLLCEPAAMSELRAPRDVADLPAPVNVTSSLPST